MRDVTKYQVNGVLDEKPKDLPEGLTVTEKKVPGTQVKKRFGSLKVEDSINHKNGAYFDLLYSTGVHLSKEDTRKVRDFLNEILDEGPKLRVIFDKHDFDRSPTSEWRWWEIPNGGFIYETNRKEAERRYGRGATAERYDYIVECYGIHQESFQE